MDAINRNQTPNQPPNEAPDHFQFHHLFAVNRLVDRLDEVTPLLALLDSPSTPAKYRQALRSVVGQEELTALALGLLRMASPQLWEAARTGELITPDLTRRLLRLGVVTNDRRPRH